MKPTSIAISFRSAGVRSFVFLVIAYILYVTWNSLFGRFMFFEVMDPSGADPHRTAHLRDSYYIIYGIIGCVLGFVATVRAGALQALITIAVSIIMFLSFRYRGIPLIFDKHSEEGFFGVRSFAAASFLIMALILGARYVWGRLQLNNKDRHSNEALHP